MVGVAAVCLLWVAGCGVSDKSLDSAEARLNTLIAQGVPDSMLTDAKVALMNARGNLRAGNAALAQKEAVAMMKGITAAEQWVTAGQETLKPKVEAARKDAVGKLDQITGEQRKVADSLLAVIDTLLAKGWVQQADKAMTEFGAAFEQLVKDEARTKEVVAKLPGLWGEQLEDKKMGVVRKKTLSFKSDKTFTLSEEMRGKTADDLKEDWEFVSGGTWEVKGDTVLMHVTREKRLRMILDRLVGGKWRRENQGSYDSSFTDNHKDVMIEFSYMQESMKKVGK